MKSVGLDGVLEIVGEQLAENGMFSGYDLYVGGKKENGLSDYAVRLIKEVLMEDPALSKFVSGAIYSLSDLKQSSIYNWKDRPEEYKTLVSSFASALYMAEDEFIEKLNKGELDNYGSLTLGDFLKTPEELRSSIDSLTTVFKSLAANSFLTLEGMENIINNFPQLIKYLGDTDNLMGAIVRNLSEYLSVYANRFYKEIMSSDEYASDFKTSIYKNDGTYGDYEYDEATLKALKEGPFGDARNMQDIVDALKLGPDALGISEDAWKQLTEQVTHMLDNVNLGKVISRQVATDVVSPYLEKLLSKELDSLNKQKEALQNINKQREYELKLIEARNKLEEAGKEKKRIWREGIGWVYEADQNALAEAQKNLDDLKNDRQIRELDIMIDQIEAQQELLKKIPEDAEFENLTKSLQSLLGEGATDVGVNGLIQTMDQLYNGTDGISTLFPNLTTALEELDKTMTNLMESNFTTKYGVNDSTSSLYGILQKEDASEAAKTAARDELISRGYSFNDSGEMESYKVPEGKLTPSDLEEMKWAYSHVTDQESQRKIAEILSNNGYEYAGGAWRTKLGEYEISGENENQVNGTWKQISPIPMTFNDSDQNYKWIQKDFESDHGDYTKVAYYEWDRSKQQYVRKGDISKNDRDYYGQKIENWAVDHDNTIINGWEGDKELAIIKGGNMYALKRAAVGSFGLPGGPALINELGTEAIVTPYGTVTSLPSGTGVVPADITKNLWELGEVAPSIAQLLNPVLRKGDLGALGDSFNVQNMVVNMNPNESFDVDRFVTELKSAVALRKNS